MVDWCEGDGLVCTIIVRTNELSLRSLSTLPDINKYSSRPLQPLIKRLGNREEEFVYSSEMGAVNRAAQSEINNDSLLAISSKLYTRTRLYF